MKKIRTMIILILTLMMLSAIPAMATTNNPDAGSSGNASANTSSTYSFDERATATAYVTANKIFIGYGGGTYNWESGLSRAELAVLLVRLCGDEVKVNTDSTNYALKCYFTDVPAWAKPYVGYCAEKGLMIGYNRSQFGPNDKVTPQHACTVILRHMEVPETEWSYEMAVSKATTVGVTPSTGFSDMTAIRRAEMAILIYKAESVGADPNSNTIVFPPSPIDSADYSNKFTLPDGLHYADESIGTLSISELGLSAKVFETEDLDNLAKGIGHFKSTSCWDGNVGFAAHNRGVANHF